MKQFLKWIIVACLGMSVLLNIYLYSILSVPVEKTIGIPFFPHADITDKDLLKNGFSEVDVDVPMLIKKNDDVKISYEMGYFQSGRIKQVLDRGKEFKNTNSVDFVKKNKPVNYVCDIKFHGEIDSTNIAKVLDKYSVEIVSCLTYDQSLPEEYVRFIAITRQTFKLFRCGVYFSENDTTLNCFYAIK